MEEMESKDLLAHARSIGSCDGFARALTVIAFAKLCVTNVGDHLEMAEHRFSAGQLPAPSSGAANEQAVAALRRVATDDAAGTVLDALRAIQAFPGPKTYRSELLGEMQKTLRLAATTPDVAWDDLACEVRDRARREGRTLGRRLVSRTLLIKGLEFDHAIVLTADELDAKNLYVALTRGSRTLTVLTVT